MVPSGPAGSRSKIVPSPNFEFSIFKHFFFAPRLLIDGEILRVTKGRKIYQTIILKTYNSKDEKSLILKSRNRTT